jgi:hypothetical protein
MMTPLSRGALAFMVAGVMAITYEYNFCYSSGLELVSFFCGGQLMPDTGLSFSSATAGARPPLNWCGRIWL